MAVLPLGSLSFISPQKCLLEVVNKNSFEAKEVGKLKVREKEMAGEIWYIGQKHDLKTRLMFTSCSVPCGNGGHPSSNNVSTLGFSYSL